MIRPTRLAKVAAVVCSLVLVGGYIYYRGGGDRRVMPGSKSGRIDTSVEETGRTFVGSSKWAPVASTNTEAPATRPVRRAMLPGSKSAPVASDVEEVATGDGSPKPTAERSERAVLPGSKSSGVFTHAGRLDTTLPATQPTTQRDD